MIELLLIFIYAVVACWPFYFCLLLGAIIGKKQAVEKPGCAIRRQPGFQHIFGKIESKIGNGQSHSISTLPVF